MRYLINLIKFNFQKSFNNTKISDKDLKNFYHLIKKDQLVMHNNSPFNKKSIKINKNILYFNHFFEDQHLQIKYDLTNKRNSILKVNEIKENKIKTTIQLELKNKNEVISFIKKLS